MTLSGLSETIGVRYRIQRRELNGQFVDDISSATVATSVPRQTLDNAHAVIRSIRGLELLERSLPADFDPTSDNLAIVEERITQTGEQEYPLGLYRLELGDTRSDRDGNPIIECDAYDLSVILTESGPDETYTISQGTNYGTAISTVITSLDLVSELTPVAQTLPVDQRWPAFPDSTWWTIIKDLADGINYLTPWPNVVGRFVWREKDANPSQGAVAVSYTDEDEPRLIAASPYRKRQQAGVLRNRAVALIDNPFHPDFPYQTIRENADPLSPISTVTRPPRQYEVKWDSVPVSTRCVFDEDMADLISETLLRDEATRYETATLQTLPDPRRGAHEYYRLTVTEKDGSYIEAGTLWRVRRWTRELVAGGVMTHELERARSVVITGGS